MLKSKIHLALIISLTFNILFIISIPIVYNQSFKYITSKEFAFTAFGHISEIVCEEVEKKLENDPMLRETSTLAPYCDGINEKGVEPDDFACNIIELKDYYKSIKSLSEVEVLIDGKDIEKRTISRLGSCTYDLTRALESTLMTSGRLDVDDRIITIKALPSKPEFTQYYIKTSMDKEFTYLLLEDEVVSSEIIR